MSTLLSRASGNYTAAATWGLCDPTSELDSQANNTAIGTAFVSSQTFTPGAITVDGVAVKVAAVSATPSGTFTLDLFNNTDSTIAASVTINVSDVNANSDGWYVLGFGAVTLIAGKAYLVRVKTSVGGTNINLYRDATVSNWSRELRTTTTQAPAVGDKLIVAGQWTAAATSSTYTVTMENTATTSFGEFNVMNKGVFTLANTASTNYYQKIAGNFNISSGGVVNFGSSGARLVASSTFSLEFACTSNVQYGLEVKTGGTINAYGAQLTKVKTKLTVDASASATALTVADTTGWKNADVIAIASTSRTNTECESKALTADAVGTALTISALTNAHLGTSPIQAELGNLTRNVKIFGTSTSNQSYINCNATSVSDFDSVEIYQMGSATTNKRGIDAQTTTGSFRMNDCSAHDFIVAGSELISTGTSINNVTLSNTVWYNFPSTVWSVSATANAAMVFSENLLILTNTSGNAAAVNAWNGTITNNTIAGGANNGWSVTTTAASIIGSASTLSGNVVHSCAGAGFVFTNLVAGLTNDMAVLASFTAYRNGTFGVDIAAANYLKFTNLTLFGNGTSNLRLGNSTNIYFDTMVSNAGTTLTSPIGITANLNNSDVFFDNCTSGVTTPHATADLSITSGIYVQNMVFRNSKLASTTDVSGNSGLLAGSFIGMSEYLQLTSSQKAFFKTGVVVLDTVIFNAASPSQRLTPNSASFKFTSASQRIAVNNGQGPVVSVWVRKSVVGDGTAYNGSQPRLILKSNPALGINADVVLATAAAAAGTWERLSGTISTPTDNGAVEILVDCDGTLGWINVDDWGAA